VLVAPNLIGDIISDNAAITQGGLGMAASANVGDTHAMFEPIHGSAPQLAGLNKANPMAIILSLSMMLEWLGEKNQCTRLKTAAGAIERAVKETIEQKILTVDLIDQTQSVDCSIVGATIKQNLNNYLVKLGKNVES
jgi:3-isopropylmalate dehydrogenase